MSIVTKEEIRNYIATFNESYSRCADEYLPRETRSRLLRYPFLENVQIGYVSTTIGAGFEYLGTRGGGAIELVIGSDPIHDLFFAPPDQVKGLKHFIDICNPDVKLIGDPRSPALFRNGYPLRITAPSGSVTLTAMRFEVSDWVRNVHMAQLYGNNSSEFWSTTNAVVRSSREIFEALMDLRRARLRNIPLEEFLRTYRERKVLLLGDYSTEGRQLLENIKAIVASLHYDAILVDEVEDHPWPTLRQKTVTLASLSRFVVIEDSTESGHLIEFVDLLHVPPPVIMIVLRQQGTRSTFMTADASYSYNGVQEFEYLRENLEGVLRGAVKWAEHQVGAYMQRGRDIYPWRTQE